MNATAANAETGTDSSDGVAPVDQRSNARLAALLDQLRRHPWPVRATFSARLALLERLLQEHFNRLPNPAFTSRVEMALRLSLDELALVLPPAEQRLLAHVRARKPLRRLDGTPGFHTTARRNERLQRLLSRVQVYCGSAARHRLMQPYDRPGHEHGLRVRRRLLPPGLFRPLRLWVPWWFPSGVRCARRRPSMRSTRPPPRATRCCGQR